MRLLGGYFFNNTLVR